MIPKKDIKRNEKSKKDFLKLPFFVTFLQFKTVEKNTVRQEADSDCSNNICKGRCICINREMACSAFFGAQWIGAVAN